MEEIMLKIDNVSKQYKLGQIGGTTLRDELQRKRAKRRGEEDPTKKIGAKDYNKGEAFMALDGVSFEVKKGERVGIIGHNGAGKSTLLKLISRVTAPTGGTISMNGRVASMLEVGTGFHPELTGRENIYMNGAILGMTKKEIDAKIEDIIEFSEVRQFIDTPVKRYSSGMYVKLAFSVAAHLDSEIMIMDEVLAVGDMAFQKKCLDKMSEVSKGEGRTILYVSHNMNTIRQLCDRVIVLDHGRVAFDGDVEEGINLYSHTKKGTELTKISFINSKRPSPDYGKSIFLNSFTFSNKDVPVYERTEQIRFSLEFLAIDSINDIKLYFVLFSIDGSKVGMAQTMTSFLSACKGEKYICTFSFDPSNLAEGEYYFQPDIFFSDDQGNHHSIEHPLENVYFSIVDTRPIGINWKKTFSHIMLNPIIPQNVAITKANGRQESDNEAGVINSSDL